MTLTTVPLRTAVDAVCAHEGTDVAGLPRPALLALVNDVAAVSKAADLVMSQAAAELERRSQPMDGKAGIAAREGYRSARELIASVTGGTMAEAQRLIETGLLLADAEAGPGGVGDAGGRGAGGDGAEVPEEPAPTWSPIEEVKAEVARYVSEGLIAVDVASLFSRALGEVPDAEASREVFLRALAKAPGLAAHKVRQLVWRAQAYADPRAWAEREEEQYRNRSVTLRDEADGMVLLTARLTPLMAAPVKAVLDAGVRRAMHARRDDPDADLRSPWQMRADFLSDVFKHMLDCDQPTSGVKTTVIVRMTREELETGLGVGEVDGMAQPVSAGALRRAAADAEVIPAVLGGASEVLDLGRAVRLFTPAQRLALVERDGGCAWCNAPPSWCEGHHIDWWERDAGPTDLANGVLLCTRCHRRIHKDGWSIDVREDPDHPGHASTVWFTPPREVDPAQVPRLGGRARYDLTERELSVPSRELVGV
jgi:hypothetical protein